MNKAYLRFALASGAALLVGSPAFADHAWGTYHWSKGTGELTVPVGDNVDSNWDSYLRVAVGGTSVGDWNDSSAIQSPVVTGGTTARRCKAAAGRIEVCNLKYGNTGWLGVAGISISGGHITSGYTKLNDTYFNTAKYNTPAWRRLVMCQEIGHDYGLGHTNEIFDNYNDGTCMDYTNAPSGGVVGGFDYGPSNEYVNQHDYDQLESIYGHAHQTTTDFGEREPGKPAASGVDLGIEGGDSPADWGRAIGYDAQGRPNIFMKEQGGRKEITHVFWAIGEGPKGREHHDDGQEH